MIMDDKSTLLAAQRSSSNVQGAATRPNKHHQKKGAASLLLVALSVFGPCEHVHFKRSYPLVFTSISNQLWALRALLWGFDRTPWSGLHFVTDHVLQPLIIPWETSECWKYESTHAISNTYSLHDTQLDTTSSIANHYLRHMDLSLNHLSTIMYFSLHLCADPNVCFVLGETATQRHNEKKKVCTGRSHGPNEDVVCERTSGVSIPHLFIAKPSETHVVQPCPGNGVMNTTCRLS